MKLIFKPTNIYNHNIMFIKQITGFVLWKNNENAFFLPGATFTNTCNYGNKISNKELT